MSQVEGSIKKLGKTPRKMRAVGSMELGSLIAFEQKEPGVQVRERNGRFSGLPTRFVGKVIGQLADLTQSTEIAVIGRLTTDRKYTGNLPRVLDSTIRLSPLQEVEFMRFGSIDSQNAH